MNPTHNTNATRQAEAIKRSACFLVSGYAAPAIPSHLHSMFAYTKTGRTAYFYSAPSSTSLSLVFPLFGAKRRFCPNKTVLMAFAL